MNDGLLVIDGFSLFFPIHLHAFHITFTLCMHSNFSCLCSHGLYFSFAHFTLVRCMIQSRPIVGSTRSPNPSPTGSGFVASQFPFACRPVLVCLSANSRFCLPTGFQFAYHPVSSFACRPIPICLPAALQFCFLANSVYLPTNSGLLAGFSSVPIIDQLHFIANQFWEFRNIHPFRQGGQSALRRT